MLQHEGGFKVLKICIKFDGPVTALISLNNIHQNITVHTYSCFYSTVDHRAKRLGQCALLYKTKAHSVSGAKIDPSVALVYVF